MLRLAAKREAVEQHRLQAEAAVARGRRRIEKQLALIAKLERGGRDTTTALNLLATLRQAQADRESRLTAQSVRSSAIRCA